MSVDIYLYTKIVYFVRVTCFDLIRSSSGPPRRQIQELFVCSYVNINNSCICLLGRAEDDLIRSKHVALTKYTIFVYK